MCNIVGQAAQAIYGTKRLVVNHSMVTLVAWLVWYQRLTKKARKVVSLFPPLFFIPE